MENKTPNERCKDLTEEFIDYLIRVQEKLEEDYNLIKLNREIEAMIEKYNNYVSRLDNIYDDECNLKSSFEKEILQQQERLEEVANQPHYIK